MRLQREVLHGVLVAVAMLILSITTISAEVDSSVESRREMRLKMRIEQLNNELLKNQSALAERQFLRGVDTTTKVLPIIEEVQIIDTVVDVVSEVVEPPIEPKPNKTLKFTPLQMDSLLSIWKERESQENYDNFFQRYINIDEESELAAIEASRGDKKATATAIDSLYINRITKLASPIELQYNSIVKSYIDRYTSPKSDLMSNILARSQYYFPMIEEELVKADLPIELRSMAVVESALISAATSRAGAMGLWQFMPSTGKMYGLEVNYLVDERCDPYKATIAACMFMKDLYRMFGDWTLALAAYNCGPTNVSKALKRSGLEEGTFWDIYHYLPRETRGYVPAFIGANYGYAYHQKHGIESSSQPLPLATDTVMINRIMHIGQVAQVLEMPIEIIRELNPQYRRDIIPATTKSYSLRLPQKYVSEYIEKESEIFAKDSLFLKSYISHIDVEKLRNLPTGTVYIVRRGDTLSGIASKYNTTTRQLMAWNNLRSAHRLSIGQKLRVR